MNREFKDALEDSPVIAAIKDDNGLKECLKSDIDRKSCFYFIWRYLQCRGYCRYGETGRKDGTGSSGFDQWPFCQGCSG